MHGTSIESLRAAHAGGRLRGRRRPAAIAAAVAVLAAVGVAGCSGHASTTAPGAASSPAAGSAAASGALPSSAAAAVPLRWSAARASLPADATGVSGQYAQLVDVSCPDVAYCVAVGSDRTSGAGTVYEGFVETLSDGSWTPTAIPDVSSSKGYAALIGVSCPARGNCVIIGILNTTAATQDPVIETLAGGRWVPVKPPLPADADTTKSATLNDVTCPAAGTCLATGWYSVQGGFVNAYVDTLANGAWTAARVPLPSDAAQGVPAATLPATFAAAVACPQAGSCVVTGQYQDDNGQVGPFIDTLAGGTWTSARAALPADAATTGQNGALWAIACPAPGACIAAGHYIVRGGQPRYLTETQSGGRWTAAALPLPADAAADQQWTKYGDTGIGALACESVGACVATAGYVDNANEILPLIETLSDGTWTATQAPLPTDAAPGTGQSNATYLQLVTCPAVGHCVTVGGYPAADGTLEALIETARPR
jgi:hypothetical protein